MIYVAMIQQSSIPDQKEGFVPAVCPECGAPCWDRPSFDADLHRVYPPGTYTKVCTNCFLINGMKEGG